MPARLAASFGYRGAIVGIGVIVLVCIALYMLVMNPSRSASPARGSEIRVSRPILLAALILCSVLGLPSKAQTKGDAQAVTPFRIFAVVWRGETEVEQGFRDYLTQRGIPFVMTVRNLNLDRGNAPPIVEEIKRVRPDLVYTWGTGTTSSIVGKIDTDTPEAFVQDIPAVFTLVSYPKMAKIVESYESTGRPVTGVAFLAPVETQLKTILAYRPFTTIAVIYDRTAGNSRINVADLREAAPALGIDLIELPVPLMENGKSDPAALPRLVEEARAAGAELLYMGPDSFLTRHAKAYTTAALAAGLPTFRGDPGAPEELAGDVRARDRLSHPGQADGAPGGADPGGGTPARRSPGGASGALQAVDQRGT